ncbi:4'-phosphopantetheinyl transferase superfamily protein [Ramlibacter sp. AN1015]|uniref:4'-phosphopantetheinyl transferase family protein n=1 Tax=Ramlibacter sp. AN1015 TaxID=3133428 RepID=UPI0030C3C16F
MQASIEAALVTALSDDEHRRAGNFRLTSKRREFVAGRAVVRMLLGHYRGVPAKDVPLVQTTHGKPSLPTGHALDFNLAHTDGLLLVAVSGGVQVGIDVERIRPMESTVHIAARFFSESERASMDEGPAGFLRSWTRRESVVKAHGTGISAGWESIRIEDRGHDEADAVGLGRDCHVRSFTPAPGYIAAVAALTPDFHIRQTRTLDASDLDNLWSRQ